MEPRVLLAGNQISFPDFSSTTGLVGNGFDGAITSGTNLRMTDGAQYEARSVWFNKQVPIDRFRTTFSYRANAGDSADGFCFVVQNGPASALGKEGLNLGYEGIDHSVAACFNQYNYNFYGSKFGFAVNGEEPPTHTDITPIDLHSGHLFHVTVKYDGTTLCSAIRDATDDSLVFRASQKIDLAATIGSHTATVGFTAATGTYTSTQDITSWNFRGAAAGVPTVVRAASADPNPVTDTRTHLDVLGGDASGEKKLTYTWSVVDMPSDAEAPSFSANATNGAKSITAQFFEPGDYTFRCTITNLSGGSVSSDVAVSVIPTATTLRTSLHAQKALFGQTIQYRTLVLDQFNAPLRSQPKIVYSIESGEGSVDADTGLFTASNNVRGHVDIGVRGGGLSGTVGVTVTGP